jgi:hypothetical protein
VNGHAPKCPIVCGAHGDTQRVTDSQLVPRVAVLDSNAIDPLSDDPVLYESTVAAIRAGRLRLLWTHVTIDELAVTSDVERRCRLLLVAVSLADLVLTGTTVVGFSRLDFCRLGSDDDTDGLEAFRDGNLKHTRDALVSSTARFEGAAVCTRDKDMTVRAERNGLEVVRPEDLPVWAGFEARDSVTARFRSAP